jgi:hypothetical protein
MVLASSIEPATVFIIAPYFCKYGVQEIKVRIGFIGVRHNIITERHSPPFIDGRLLNMGAGSNSAVDVIDNPGLIGVRHVPTI